MGQKQWLKRPSSGTTHSFSTWKASSATDSLDPRQRLLSRMSPQMADGLVRHAQRVGADPWEWYGTFKPVPFEEWIELQVYKNGAWTTTRCFTTPLNPAKLLAFGIPYRVA